MAIAPQPSILNMAWASNPSADKNVIPDTMQVADMSNDAAASWSMGFPSQTSLSQGQGGYYVSRQDVNGALNRLSEFAMYAQSGAIYNWSASVDYGVGAHVRGSDGVEYIALANNGPGVSSAVNPATDVSYTTWKPYLRSIADFIYPVGSIYMSLNNTSPSVLFGGTWVQIAGKFLLASGGGYTKGDEGGNPGGLHTLASAEMPQHAHTVTVQNSVGHTHDATSSDAGNHTHTVTVEDGGAHTHTISVTNGAQAAGAHSHTISVTGGAQSAGAHTHTVARAAQTISVTTGGAGSHTHTVTGPTSATTLSAAALSAGSHTHARGTLNIKGTFDADDFTNDITKPSVTGAFGYFKSETRRDSEDGTNHGYGISFNAANGWEGSLANNGSHTHDVKISKNGLTMTVSTVAAHTHSVSVTVPAQTLTAASNGAHTHNLSGSTASIAAHTHNISGTTASGGTHNHTASTGEAGNHSHTITVKTSGIHTHNVTVGTAGGNTAFSIMPPYLVVNVWKRTA